MSIIQDKLNKISPKNVTLLMLALPVLMVAAFVWFVYLPYSKEKSDLDITIKNVQSGISQSQVMERKLGELKAANVKLQQELKAATERLPSSEEDAQLKDRMKGLISESGLTLKSWDSGKKETDESGLYSQTSTNVEVVGSYHEVGKFMDGLDKMTRMLNITDFTMSAAKLEGKKMNIPVKFTLIAYSAAGGK